MSQKNLDILQEKLGYVFQDSERLSQAFRHASVTSKKQQSYERLEFLGDRILGLGVAELLYKAYPEDTEGELARRHSPLVSAETLCAVARHLDLQDFIQAETKDFSKNRPSVMADGVESLLAVVYLESGLGPAQKIIERFWSPLIKEMVEAPKDPKSAVQEWAHRHKKTAPLYELLNRSGPDHNPVFSVRVSLDRTLHETAEGSSLKQAEKTAAQNLLKKLT